MFRSPLDVLNRIYLRVFDSEFMRRILRNSGYLVSATVATAGIGIIQNYFQFRVLGVPGVGLLAAMAGFTNVVNRFTAFRIDELVVKYVRHYVERKQPQQAAAVFKLAALLEGGGALVAFALIFILAPFGVELFSDQGGVESLFVLYGSLVLINMAFDSSDGILQVFNRFGAKAIIDICQSLLRLGLTVWVFYTGGGLMHIVLAELAGRLLRSLAVMTVALRTVRREWGPGWWRRPISTLKEDQRSLLVFAFSTNMSATVSLVAKDSEDLWVNAFLGNVSGGIYAAARNLIGLLQIPVSPLPSTTYPELSRASAQENWKAMRGVLRRGTLLAGLYSLPVAVVLILFGRQVITLYQGADFLPAYAPLVILTVGYTFVNLFYWSRAGLLALNRPVFPTIVNFIGMLLKIAGVFAVAKYGAVGFAALLSGYYVFTVTLSVLRIQQDLRRNLALAS